MKLSPRIFVTAVLSLATATSFAGNSSGTRGGGQTVDVEGRPSLRDLVDKTVCRWTEARKMRDSLPELSKILEKLSSINWYYKSLFSNEAGGLKICMTEGTLSRINPIDQDGLTIGEVDGRQVAIRWDDKIYIDKKIFNQMDETNKGYLFFHEVMHSFIPMEATQRNIKLRSFVHSVRDFVENRMTSEDLMFQMEQDSVQWPDKDTLTRLEPLKAYVLKLNSDNKYDQKVAALQLKDWSRELGDVSDSLNFRVTEIAEAASKDAYDAIKTCDIDELLRIQSHMNLESIIHGSGGQETAKLNVPSKNSYIQFDDSYSPAHVIWKLIERSNSNQKLHLDDKPCVSTLALLLNSKSSLGKVISYPIVDQESRYREAFEIEPLNPEILPLLLERGEAFKENAAAEKKKAVQLALEKKLSALSSCATDAKCVEDFFTTFARIDPNDPTDRGFFNIATHISSYKGDRNFIAYISEPSEFDFCYKHLMSAPQLDLSLIEGDKKLLSNRVFGAQLKTKIAEQRKK